MRRWDESPENEDAVLIELRVDGRVLTASSERGYFHAFCEIRKQLEPLDIVPKCFAASENVYPSPMIESMGCGEKAYRLTLGKQARMSDLIEIFETADDVHPVSVELQRKYYKKWIESL
jgi:hypothetical protein